MTPETFGPYRVVAPLGQGRTGIIYSAVEEGTNRKVTVKQFPAGLFPSGKARERFFADVRAAAALDHPNVRRLLKLGEIEGGAFVVSEYLEGATLATLLVPGPLDLDTALAWGVELAEALAAVHRAGLVQGELTSGKVFITKEGTVKLLDAGLWRPTVPGGTDFSVEGKLAELDILSSVVASLSPEQLRGAEPDARSDVFALGALLYEMTTGRHPFGHPDPVQTMHWVLKRQPEPPSRLQPALPAALDAVIARAMEKEPAARFGVASEVADALRAVAAGEPLPAMPSPEKLAAEVSARRLVLRMTAPLWFGIGTLILLAVLWFVFLALRQP